MILRRLLGLVDRRLGVAPVVRSGLRYVFPDHWSFLLGEIALYSFVMLVATGIFLGFYYEASDVETVYTGVYEPLRGRVMSRNYISTLDISFEVPAGLLIRQTHHWAANLFIAAITIHMLRILLTGAFRKPRELNYLVGVTLLGLAILEGFTGYSLPDDLLSGMGLAIAYGVAMSLPVIGGQFAFVAWGGEFPGGAGFFPRLYTTHILIVPIAIGTLIALHLAMIMRQHHTQFAGPGRTERNVVGTPMWPAYALRSIGLFLATASVLFLLGGLVQVNPVWEWGYYEPYLGSNGAQPDWYLGWLIGSLRLMPPLEVVLFDYTLVPNPFFGGALFPLIVFGILYAWPLLVRRLSGDGERHELLERPRDNPRHTGAVVALTVWVFGVFVAGSTDRVYYRVDIPYEAQVWYYRVAVFVVPVIAYLVTVRLCRHLQARAAHPLRGWSGQVVRRNAAGGFETVALDDGSGRRAAGHGHGDGDGADGRRSPPGGPESRAGSESRGGRPQGSGSSEGDPEEP